MKKTESIMQSKDSIKKRQCYLCMELNGDDGPKYGLQEHHIFGGPNRYLSEFYGLKVKLCGNHHGFSGHDDVHREDLNNHMQFLHKAGEEVWIDKIYMPAHPDETLQDACREFVRIFGRNYLQDLTDKREKK